MAYNQDRAYIHDAAFSRLALDAAATLLRILSRQKIRRGLIVDLGCGSGRLAEKLTRAGYEVLGIDISAAMLRLARKRAPKAKFVQGSLFAADLPDCVAVTAIGECVNYLFDQRGANDVRRLLRRVDRALVPRGVFLFDVVCSSEPGPVLSHSAGKNWAILVTKQTNPRTHVLTRSMTIFRRVGRQYRRSREVHRQKLYSVNQITRELKRAGFALETLSGYGEAGFLPGRAGFIARKK